MGGRAVNLGTVNLGAAIAIKCGDEPTGNFLPLASLDFHRMGVIGDRRLSIRKES